MVGICRLCASLRKADSLLTITDTNHEVCQKLRQCCQVEIQLDDSLPKCICCDCVQALQQAYAFYTKVHESQESLVALFPPAKPNTAGSSTNANSSKDPTLAESLAPALFLTVDKAKKTEGDVKSLKHETELERVTIVDTKVGEDHAEQALDEKQVLEMIDSDVTLILNKEFDGEIDNEELIIEKILDRSYRGEIQSDGTPTGSDDEEDGSCDSKNVSGSRSQELQTSRRISKRRRSQKDEPDVEQVFEFVLESEKLDTEDEESAAEFSDDKSHEKWTDYPWSCYLCGTVESSYTELVMHCQVTHDMQASAMQFKCFDCQKICTRYYAFLNHVRYRHRKALTLCCDICNVRCDDFKKLSFHRLVEHADTSEYPCALHCNQCGRCFSNSNALQIHVKGHEQTEKYECEQCGSQFSRLYSLKAHQKVHSGVKEFNCEQCGKSFRQRANLMSHMNSHIDDKPYECPTCHKFFKSSPNLLKHIATHSDVKEFACDHCEKRFRTKDAKLSHERTHTGEMPYTCKYCSRPFRFRSTYLSHLNTHTGNRPYSCTDCDHHFTNWSNYNKHMKRIHSNEKTNSGAISTAKKRKVSQEDVVESMSFEVSLDSEEYEVIEITSLNDNNSEHDKEDVQ